MIQIAYRHLLTTINKEMAQEQTLT